MITSAELAQKILETVPSQLERIDMSATYSRFEYGRLAAALYSVRARATGEREITLRHNAWAGQAGKAAALIDRATEDMDLPNGNIVTVDDTTTKFTW